MASTSADRFARYEEDFLNSSRIITRTISQLSGTRGNAGELSKNIYLIAMCIEIITLVSLDAIISFSVDVECELSEAEAYLRAMDVEFRSMPSGDKRAISVKVFSTCTVFR